MACNDGGGTPRLFPAPRSGSNARMAPRATVVLPFLVFALTAQSGNGLVVQPDPENVVANHLVGTWRLDAALQKSLCGREAEATYTFRPDPAVLGSVPMAAAAKLKGQPIFLAGWVGYGTAEDAFLLTVANGVPRLVWFRRGEGDRLGDGESRIVALVRSEAPGADLLFVSGDPEGKSFVPYRRDGGPRVALTAEASITEMLRLLEAGKKLEFVKTFAAPDDLAKMEKEGSKLAKIVERMDDERIGTIVAALQFAAKNKPTADKDGDLLTWELPEELRAKGPARLSLQRIDGRWYLRN